MENVVICGAARTPIGGFQGAFDAVPAARLGGAAIEAALQQTSLSSVDEVVMGNVLGAGQGQAPARQASFHAGLGAQVPATTLNKMCGSGMKATMIGFDQIALGQTQVMAVGGMESMSNAPYLLPKMRSGARLGHSQVADHMFLDGLEDAYENGRLMGSFAEDCAEKYQFTREAQDDYALRSLIRAREAQSSGAFEKEITPFNLARKKGDYAVMQDEQPLNAKPEKIPHLKPAFRADGSVTAANASSISDGAAALIVSSQTHMQQAGLPCRARILGHASHAQEPAWFSTAPIFATRKLLDRLNWRVEDVDLWEVNEAFASVVLGWAKTVGADMAKVNPNGGAIALGHPLGATGCFLTTKAVHELQRTDGEYGLIAMCCGGGLGTGTIIQKI